MEGDTLTILTLIWFIYTYLIVEADKQLSELIARLRVALTVNEKGVINQKQQIGISGFSFAEMAAYRDAIGDKDHTYFKFIEKTLSKKASSNKWRIYMMANLFLLSTTMILKIIIMHPYITSFINFHVLGSLVLSAAYYYICVNQIQNVTFLIGKPHIRNINDN